MRLARRRLATGGTGGPMGSVRPYLQYARLAFQRRAAYRAANWSGVAVNFFFLLVHAQVLTAFFRARPNASGWSADDAILYYATSEALLMVVGTFPDYRFNLAERVRTGEIVTDLARPITLYYREVGERFGTGLYYMLARFVPVYGLGLAFFGLLPPLRPELLWFPISLALALGVAAGMWYVVCSSAFFRESAAGELSALVFINVVLGGAFVPLDFYPGWLRAIADVAPFRAGLYTPVAILAGKLAGAPLVYGLLHQVVWVVALGALALHIEGRGLRRLAAQGG
jgi:ABC-2 type transport system permease protein